jgi:UDP-glucuronate 4-epimerase
MMPMQPEDVEQTWADTSAIFKDYNYKLTTKIDKGIEKFVDWYKDYFRKQLNSLFNNSYYKLFTIK